MGKDKNEPKGRAVKKPKLLKGKGWAQDARSLMLVCKKCGFMDDNQEGIEAHCRQCE